MHRTGLAVDTDQLNSMLREALDTVNERTRFILNSTNERFDVADDHQVGVILFEKVGLEPHSWRNGRYHLSDAVLSRLENPLAEAVREHRAACNDLCFLTTIQSEIRCGRVHPRLRLSDKERRIHASSPPLQSLRRDLRSLIVPTTGFLLVGADWRQSQICVLAALSGDPNLVRIIGSGEDVYEALACAVYEATRGTVGHLPREKIKKAVYSLLLGAGLVGMCEDGDIAKEEAKAICDAFNSEFSVARKYISRVKVLARKNLYVETMGGRQIDLDQCHKKGQLGKNAVSAAISGTEADVFHSAMLDVASRLSHIGGRILLPIHDGILAEAPISHAVDAAQVLAHCMSRDFGSIALTARVTSGVNWRDMS